MKGLNYIINMILHLIGEVVVISAGNVIAAGAFF